MVPPSSSPPDSKNLGIIVFLRYPLPGQVKTRLAKTVGDARACEIYRACAEGVLKAVCRFAAGGRGAKLYVFFSVAEEAGEVEDWVRSSVSSVSSVTKLEISFRPQKQTACLGARMADAFSYVERRGHGRICILGTDVPDLGDDRVLVPILDAAVPLPLGDGGDFFPPPTAVFGPSVDGGFYCLLMDGLDGSFFDAHGDVFDGIAWSTETVLEETSKAMARVGVRVVQEGWARLRDLDEWEDCVAWRETVSESGGGRRRFDGDDTVGGRRPVGEHPNARLVEVIGDVLGVIGAAERVERVE